MCVDYRTLNKYTVRDNYPLPLIEDCLEYFTGKKIFTLLDLKSGFHQVKVSLDSTYLTSFVTPNGQYEFLRMPFGLKNAPSPFQRFISRVFRKFTDSKQIVVYMDDIVIASGWGLCVGATSLPRKKPLVTNRPNASERNDPTVDDPGKRSKDNDFRICTWNVRTLNRPHAADQLAEALDCYKADITAIQEVRWDGPGKRRMKNCDIYYGDCYREQKQRLFGCGFVRHVRGSQHQPNRQEVLSFRHVSKDRKGGHLWSYARHHVWQRTQG